MKKRLGIEAKLLLIALVMIIFFTILFSSCIVEQELTQPFIGDGVITKVDKRFVYTRNYKGFEVPHRIIKDDTTNYAIGSILIYEQK